MDYELQLFDRIEVIKTIINKHGEENFYLSFSGGKDSTVLHNLLDEAIPGNQIPRVYIDTGIEYESVRKFVKELQLFDNRITIIKPSVPIKAMLERDGYPFKSKEHSLKVGLYQSGSRCKSVLAYKDGTHGKLFRCPKSLLFQFDDGYPLKLSDKCCLRLKKEPVRKWQKESDRTIAITAMRKDEKGQRAHIGCIMADKGGNLKKFHPLAVISEEWEEWYIKERDIKLCELYYPPFNFKRTGCKGCPFALDLQDQLTKMLIYLPNERKQCELIWGKVYAEYRRLGYRLDKYEQLKLF